MTDPCLGTQLVRLRFKGFCFSGSLTLAVSELGIGPRGITSLSLLHPELLPSLSSVLNYFPLGPDCSLFTHRPGGAAAFFLPPVSEATGSFQVWEPRALPPQGGGSCSLPVYLVTSRHAQIVSQVSVFLLVRSANEQRVLGPGSGVTWVCHLGMYVTWESYSASLSLSFHLRVRGWGTLRQLPGWCKG